MSAPQLRGTRYTVRQQLYTVHQNFEVIDAGGTNIMTAHGNGLRVMDKIELRDSAGKAVLELRQRAAKRPHVDVVSNGKKLLSVGERRVGLRDHFVVDTVLPAKFEITGNAWSQLSDRDQRRRRRAGLDGTGAGEGGHVSHCYRRGKSASDSLRIDPRYRHSDSQGKTMTADRQPATAPVSFLPYSEPD